MLLANIGRRNLIHEVHRQLQQVLQDLQAQGRETSGVQPPLSLQKICSGDMSCSDWLLLVMSLVQRPLLLVVRIPAFGVHLPVSHSREEGQSFRHQVCQNNQFDLMSHILCWLEAAAGDG